jgi:hypothetical protein
MLDYDIVFYPSTALTGKVLDLTWCADLPDDFTSGINIFNLGAVSEQSLVPFHIECRLQLDINFWFKRQGDTTTIVPVPDLCEV